MAILGCPLASVKVDGTHVLPQNHQLAGPDSPSFDPIPLGTLSPSQTNLQHTSGSLTA